MIGYILMLDIINIYLEDHPRNSNWLVAGLLLVVYQINLTKQDEAREPECSHVC